jgi:hypothetical protein
MPTSPNTALASVGEIPQQDVRKVLQETMRLGFPRATLLEHRSPVQDHTLLMVACSPGLRYIKSDCTIADIQCNVSGGVHFICNLLTMLSEMREFKGQEKKQADIRWEYPEQFQTVVFLLPNRKKQSK